MAGLKEIWRYASMSTNIIIRCVLAVAGLVILISVFIGGTIGFISESEYWNMCLIILVIFVALGAFSFMTDEIDVFPKKVDFRRVKIIIYSNKLIPFFMSVGGMVFYALRVRFVPTICLFLYIPYILGLIYIILARSISLVVEFKPNGTVNFYTPFKTLTGNIQEFSVARPSQTEIHIIKGNNRIVVKSEFTKSLNKLWSYLYHRINALKKDKQN